MIDLIKNQTFTTKRFKEFKGYLKDQDERKSEQVVQFKDWKFTEEGLKIKKKEYPMRDSAMKTLLSTFGMPSKFYYTKSPTDMLIRDINRMKREYTEDSEMLVYFQDDEVRAVSKPSVRHATSHRQILDNSILGDVSFKMGSYNDYGMRMTTADDSKQVKVTKDDIMNVGSDLIYSDTGSHPTTGSPFLLRLVCTNGLVVKEKSPFLNSFSMSFGQKFTEDTFLETLNHNVSSIDIDTKILGKTFKAMRDQPINSLQYGESHMKKLRSAIGISKFDEHEKLSVKILDDEHEGRMINTELPLYSALDITTRMAKKYDSLTRRRIESLAGSLVVMSERELLH